MEKSKKIYFENLPKATMQREINDYLMGNGFTPLLHWIGQINLTLLHWL